MKNTLISSIEKRKSRRGFSARLNALTSFLCMFTSTQSHPGESSHHIKATNFSLTRVAHAFHASTISCAFVSQRISYMLHAEYAPNIGNFI